MNTVIFKAGSQAHKLLSLLSVVGEMGLTSMSILGSRQSLANCIQDWKNQCHIKIGEETLSCRLLIIKKTHNIARMHLTKKTYPLLKLIGADEYYENTFPNNHFESSYSHLDRRLRVAETVALCMVSGIEFRPYRLPKLQIVKFIKDIPKEPIFYPIKVIKDIGGEDADKQIRGTRMTGTIITSNGGFAVYNLRDYVIQWSNSNERRGKAKIKDIIRLNYGLRSELQGIFLGNSYETAYNNLEFIDKERSNKKRRYKISEEIRFDDVFNNVHFVPLNEFGAKLLQLITIPNFHSKMISLLFPIEYRAPANASIDYDARIGDKYIMSFLSSDITKLMRFREGIKSYKVKAEVICYPEQVKLIKKYLGSDVSIRTVKIDKILKDFNVKRRNLFEKL